MLTEKRVGIVEKSFEDRSGFSINRYGLLGFKAALCIINTNPFLSAPHPFQEKKNV